MCSRPVGRMPLRTRLRLSGALSAGGTLMSPLGTGFFTAPRLPCAQQVSSDDQALNFAGAFVDREDARVAVHALDVTFTRIAHAAMNLHSLIGDAIGRLGGKEFRARRKGCRAG